MFLFASILSAALFNFEIKLFCSLKNCLVFPLKKTLLYNLETILLGLLMYNLDGVIFVLYLF